MHEVCVNRFTNCFWFCTRVHHTGDEQNAEKEDDEKRDNKSVKGSNEPKNRREGVFYHDVYNKEGWP